MPVDRLGPGRPATLAEAAAAPGVAVVAVQAANHEVGTLQPVAELAAAPDDVPLFIDACASAGRLPLPDGWAAAAALGPQVGRARPGVGVLLVRKGARWRNPFPGDDRVDERATGFENVPGGAGRRRRAAGRGRRARRGRRAASARWSTGSAPRVGGDPGRRGRRRPRSTGSPTW